MAARKNPAKTALKKYQSMRDFTVTAEPSGHKPVKAGKRCAMSSRSMPRPGCITISGWN